MIALAIKAALGVAMATGYIAWLLRAGQSVMPRCVVPCRLCGTPSSKHACERCGAVTP